MQHGSMIRAKATTRPHLWDFRWREPGPDGKRKHRRMVLGSVEKFPDEAAARQAITALDIDINYCDPRTKANLTTVAQLADHSFATRVQPDKVWKTRY
jgi:hypothetical protein